MGLSRVETSERGRRPRAARGLGQATRMCSNIARVLFGPGPELPMAGWKA